jgi:hypothetical protein
MRSNDQLNSMLLKVLSFILIVLGNPLHIGNATLSPKLLSSPPTGGKRANSLDLIQIKFSF